MYTLDSFPKFVQFLSSLFDDLLDWLKTGCSLHRFHGLAGVAEVGDVVSFEGDHQLVSDHTVGTEKCGAGEAVCHSGRGRLAASAVRDTEILSLISRWRHQHRPCLVVVVVIQSQGRGYGCSVDEVQWPGRRLSNRGRYHGLLQVGVIGRLPRSGGDSISDIMNLAIKDQELTLRD